MGRIQAHQLLQFIGKDCALSFRLVCRKWNWAYCKWEHIVPSALDFIKAASQDNVRSLEYIVNENMRNGKQLDAALLDNLAVVKACENGNLHIVKYLFFLRDTSHPEIHFNHRAILAAASSGNIDVLQFLVQKFREGENELNPSSNNNDAFRLAAQHGHIETVKYLLSLKDIVILDSDVLNNTFAMVCWLGKKDVVEFLLHLKYNEEGMMAQLDPFANENEALKWAQQAKRKEIVQLLQSISNIEK